MNVLHRLVPRTIAAQITCIVIAAVLLGAGLASAVVFALFSTWQTSANQEVMAAGRAARIAAITARETPGVTSIAVDDVGLDTALRSTAGRDRKNDGVRLQRQGEDL